MQFVAWPDHVAIMKEYRQRGRLRSTTWTAEQADPSAVWQAALPHLASR
ncbi:MULTISPECIES: hypothetical protein [Nocardioides]|uniref:Uncharacterized protein n=1 Tax=Nocardioides vastitatis TaxID=2568655 RepID=A0ABW0ZAT5_9ACTN|nr:hypothetical protein [Nocardioides sp.]